MHLISNKMVLKSYRLTKKSKKKKKRSSSIGGIITGATGAIIGTAFVSQTAGVLNRL